MAADPTPLDRVLKRFAAKKIMTLAELAQLLACSTRTVHRRLKGWQAINSYNRNGRYYTLPQIPQYDDDGLWHYRGVSFSRHGNLTQTVVELVKQSAAGLSGAELSHRLGLDPRSFLSFFRHHPGLKREVHEGRYVYFCGEPTVYRRQRNRRATLSTRIKPPTDAEAIAILVETIKHPQRNLDQLCGALKRQGIKVSPQAVSNLFAQHGLELKKTPRSAS